MYICYQVLNWNKLRGDAFRKMLLSTLACEENPHHSKQNNIIIIIINNQFYLNFLSPLVFCRSIFSVYLLLIECGEMKKMLLYELFWQHEDKYNKVSALVRLQFAIYLICYYILVLKIVCTTDEWQINSDFMSEEQILNNFNHFESKEISNMRLVCQTDHLLKHFFHSNH